MVDPGSEIPANTVSCVAWVIASRDHRLGELERISKNRSGASTSKAMTGRQAWH